MELTSVEADDYFGLAEAVFRCLPCEEQTDCTVYLKVLLRWLGSVWVEGGEPRADRPEGDFFGCPCCDSDAGSTNISMVLVDERVHCRQRCDACNATWTDVFNIMEEDHA